MKTEEWTEQLFTQQVAKIINVYFSHLTFLSC